MGINLVKLKMTHFISKSNKYIISTNYKVLWSLLSNQPFLQSAARKDLELQFKPSKPLRRMQHFLLVRDPYRRLESFYKNKLCDYGYYKLQACQEIFVPHLKISSQDSPTAILEKIFSLSFAEFINLLPIVYQKDPHLHPQVWKMNYNVKGRLIVPIKFDRILKIESADDMAYLQDELSIDLRKKYNSTHHIPLPNPWQPSLRAVVNYLYQADFDRFNYKMHATVGKPYLYNGIKVHHTPLVSCIMPTYNRRHFVSQSIWYFLWQDYPARELIIVDDGSDRVADLLPNDERIRYVRLEKRHSVGAKRNLACEVSRGELIAHWDDDDWYAPNRLSLQVRELLSSEKDVCGTSDLLFYHLMTGQAWRYRYPANRRPWLAGSTLLYHRSVWAAHPFADRNVGEGTAFVWQLAADRLHRIADNSLAVAIIHQRNTAAKSLRGPRWQRRPLSEVTQLLAAERDFYVTLRNGRPVPSSIC